MFNIDKEMFTFSLDCEANAIQIYKGGHLVAERIVLNGTKAVFDFKSWVENWLDEQELYDVEYRTFIRIH